MGMAPSLRGLRASARRSGRRSAMREPLSGPWQRKQVSDMMGRMSRLNSTGAAAGWAERGSVARNRARGNWERLTLSILCPLVGRRLFLSGLREVIGSGALRFVGAAAFEFQFGTAGALGIPAGLRGGV